MNKIILITGEPGVGKTTIVKKIKNKLCTDGIKAVGGFYTEELRDSFHNRIGFDVIDINDQNRRAPLARSSMFSFESEKETTAACKNAPKVGKYFVDVNSFESIFVPTLIPILSDHIYLIDEIGKMEMFSSLFEKTIVDYLKKVENEKIVIVATVPTKSLTLSDKVKNHACSKLFTVTHQNRNRIVDEIYDQVLHTFKTFSSQ